MKSCALAFSRCLNLGTPTSKYETLSSGFNITSTTAVHTSIYTKFSDDTDIILDSTKFSTGTVIYKYVRKSYEYHHDWAKQTIFIIIAF